MKKIDKRSKIMMQSKELFERFGYQKTTLTDIAKSAGFVKSAIYYYFSGKEEIFAGMVQREAELFLDALIEGVQQSDDPSEQLRLYVTTRIDLMEKVSKRYAFLKSEFFELMPIVEENRKESDLREVKFLTELLHGLVKSGKASIANPEFSAKLLMQNIKGLEIQMFVTDSVQAHKEDREAFVDFLLYGIVRKS